MMVMMIMMMMMVVLMAMLSVAYMSLSVIGSMSSTYCRNLLCIIIATPAANSSLPPSPLKNHVYCFLDSLVLQLLLVSCSPVMFMFLRVIHRSTSSLTPALLVPRMFSVAILKGLPSDISILSRRGS